ncbi:MAG: response regulator [Planctomycetes bacterium]|nr:response regulator [Planctomycetota bacterium]
MAHVEGLPSRLLERAVEADERDTYAGKRAWTRYRLGMRVEATTDPTRPSASWHVSIHNVSGGGIALWSTVKLPIASAVWVRDCVEEDRPKWLKGRVAHCTVGLRGHLIGVAFDERTSPDSHEPPPLTYHEEETEEFVPVAAAGRLETLQTKCIYATIIAVSASIAIMYLLSQNLFPTLDREMSGVIAIASALCTGALCGWIIARGEARFLRELHLAIRGMASGKLDSCNVTEAPCAELAAIGRAFNELRTRWKQREQGEHIQRQKLEELAQIKTNILSIVSHDLRTPLTSILMYANMLLEASDDLTEEESKDFLNIICDECNRLARLVDDILEVQRLESDAVRLETVSCDLGPTIENCVRVFQPLAETENMTLTSSCLDSLPAVLADADKISQVVNNLIANALKYTPSGGSVHVSAERRGKELLISVADSGPGIPRDKWDHIFERFAQATDLNSGEVAGVGLGLYIVRCIVQSHGGTAWVDSKVGEGSSFYVALPLEGEPILTPPSLTEGVVNANCKVIACDSDPELAATLSHTLRVHGYDVRSAHSGRRLLQHLEQGDVDVVITDILMPDMSSAELLNALNSFSGRAFRTIIHSYEGDAEGYGRRGVDVFLRRPVSRDELIEAVQVAMRRGSVAGSTAIVVQDEHVNVDRLCRLLSDAGHMTMVAGDVSEATVLCRKYSGDFTVLSSEAALSNRAELLNLIRHSNDTAQLVVLSNSDRKTDRELQEGFGAVLVAYTPGQEEAVVDIVRSLNEEQTKETPV